MSLISLQYKSCWTFCTFPPDPMPNSISLRREDFSPFHVFEVFPLFFFVFVAKSFAVVVWVNMKRILRAWAGRKHFIDLSKCPIKERQHHHLQTAGGISNESEKFNWPNSKIAHLNPPMMSHKKCKTSRDRYDFMFRQSAKNPYLGNCLSMLIFSLENGATNWGRQDFKN